MMPFVNRAGATFIGDVIGIPPTESTPQWMCVMHLVPGGLTDEVRKPFERLIRAHAKENGWRVEKFGYTRRNVTFYLSAASSA